MYKLNKFEVSNGQVAALHKRQLKRMLQLVEEYELVKTKQHPEFKKANEFYDKHKLCRQNFLKYYARYMMSGRSPALLLPIKTGRKFKDSLQYAPEVLSKIQEVREKGYNRFDIAMIVNQSNCKISPSGAYRVMRKLGINRLNPIIKEAKKRIIKMEAGELGHVDVHYVKSGTVKGLEKKKLYILGLIDDHSRVCWLEVIDSIKSLNVMFVFMDMMFRLKDRYDIKFESIMSDNGSEFSGRTNKTEHPFEKMLEFYKIKHIYTRPYRPQTNGKIERFWKTLNDELLEDQIFEDLEDFKTHILGYTLYYNEHRTHQGIDNKTPLAQLKK